MKWVKFKHEFDEGQPLHRFLEQDNIKELTIDPEAPENNVGKHPIIFKSANKNGIINRCFRIYNLSQAEFEDDLLKDGATYKDRIVFHRWGYVIEIPESYDPDKLKSLKSPNYSLLQPYELFFGGWIDFWDTEVRQDGTDHAVYFRLIEHAKGRYTVITYITQTKSPVHLNVYVNVANPPTSTDPPPTTGKPPY